GGVDQTHGAIRLAARANEACGDRKIAGLAGQMRIHPRGAPHNHLPVDAQVPAGLGTATEPTLRSPPSGCPGFFGPVPQPVSMDARRLPASRPLVNRFMPMKRYFVWTALAAIIRAMRPALPFVAALLLAACATPRVPVIATGPATPPPAEVATVPERYVTIENPDDELDSLATWPTEDGAVWLIATAKNTHELVVFDADSGEQLRGVGRRGSGEGEFLRPNGVFVHGDLLLVSERDNRRVQMLSLPGFRPLGSFGEGLLRSPYGLWAHEPEPGELQVYVTDSFMDGADFRTVPPLSQLDRRVHRFRIDLQIGDPPQAHHLGTFGDTAPATALHIVESLHGDP